MIKHALPLLFLLVSLSPAIAQDSADPLASFTRGWRNDSIWHDGKAEMAIYDATRTIYGKSRKFQATIYTNKEVADAEPSFTKSPDNEGREVFKHHLREDVPTENYDYHYSVMSYVGTQDLKSLKLDVGSIEDCGTTFKQYINHAGTMRWQQNSYFPEEGARTGTASPAKNFAFADALTLVLRGYPFEKSARVTLTLLPSQISNKLAPSEPEQVAVEYVGKETLDLPRGKTAAHHLRVVWPKAGEGSQAARDYWFAADSKLQHVLVKYDDGKGTTYALRSVERKAYWERP